MAVLSLDGDKLFLPGRKELTVWHLKTGNVYEATYPFARVEAAAVSRDGRTLALLLHDLEVVLLRVSEEP